MFRFTADKDMFYVPYSDNDKELARLEACVKEHKADILAGKLPLHVDGYCNSTATEKENLAIAKIRSNRVKSELIIRSGLTESCFVTRNHAYGGDYVSVRLVVPMTDNKRKADVVEQAVKERAEEQARLEAERRSEQERVTKEQAAREQAEAERVAERAERERLETEERTRLQAEAEAAANAKP